MSLLICGHEESLLSRVKRLLLTADSVMSSDGQFDDCMSHSSGDKQVMRLVNKYFTAEVELTSLLSHQLHEGVDAEGVIWVVSPLKSTPLADQVAALEKFAEPRDFELRLAVCFEDEDLNALEEWAINHSFEALVVNMTKLTESVSEREKYGFPRLLEALSNSMWSTVSKNLAPTKTSGSADSRQAPSSEPSEVEVDRSAVPTAEAQPENRQLAVGTTTEVVNVPASRTDGEGGFDFAEALMKELEAEQREDTNDDEEVSLELLSQFMSQARQIREQALSGNLSDEARRAKATEVALQFAKLLNMEMDDDSDDEEP